MLAMNTAAATRSIVVEGDFPYPPQKLWRALTEDRLIAQWLMPTTFDRSTCEGNPEKRQRRDAGQLAVGTRFTFKTKPMGDWDGVVHCEVLTAEAPRLLRYSWKGGSETNSKYGSTLDSVVTWTLTATPGGTHLKLEHAGVRSPQNDFAYDAMSPGWGRIIESIGRVIEAM
jgi:uncharacterized protein YndB with AHSA1/START domain